MIRLPVHPMVVHFPIALFITALAVEVFSRIFKKEAWHQCAMLLFFAAVLLCPVAVASGLWEEEQLHMHHPLLERHEQLGLITMFGSWLACGVLGVIHKRRPQFLRNIFLLVLVLMSLLVIVTAYHGGRLVYEYGAGVDL